MDQGVLLNTLGEQRNEALNQVALTRAQLATANKTIADLQAQCDALNAKLQEVSQTKAKTAGLDPIKKRPGRKAKASAASALNGTGLTVTADPSETAN